MILCKFEHLAARCEERGYDINDAIACIVWQQQDNIVVDETHAAYPRARLGLGDFVAACLSAIGITKERVSRWLGYDCGCAQRQARWNELGWHLVAIVRRRIGIG